MIPVGQEAADNPRPVHVQPGGEALHERGDRGAKPGPHEEKDRNNEKQRQQSRAPLGMIIRKMSSACE